MLRGDAAQGGADTLATNMDTLASGTAQVSDGASELASSSVTLRDGTGSCCRE
ncbi:hypothetical protein NKG05_18020 [Oerskovia sp. M15]